MDQFGNVRFAYKRYSVEEVGLDKRGDGAYPRKIRPNQPIDVVHNRDAGGPAASVGNWGMNTGRFDWNARDDRLAESPLWSAMWGKAASHVVIPVSHGYEMTKRHGDRRWSCVVREDNPDEPWWVPGLGRIQNGKFRTEWHVTMVTVEAGPVFDPIHDTPREIVALRDWKECQTWLAGDDAACRKLLRPATTDLLGAYRVHDDVLRDAFPAAKAPLPWRPPGLAAF
ncbi:MAG: SOS response-associated peptidase family protein [bacterium]